MYRREGGESEAAVSQASPRPLLFEHFLVVGAPASSAVELGDQILNKATSTIADRMRSLFLTPSKDQSPEVTPSSETQRRTTHTENSVVVDPEILYRFPAEADPPPGEVTDFCLPMGGCVEYMPPSEQDSLVKELFYGQGNGLPSSRCFLFMLEDKSQQQPPARPASASFSSFDGELGIESGRLFGICVVQPRLLRVPVELRQSDGTWFSSSAKLHASQSSDANDGSAGSGAKGVRGSLGQTCMSAFQSEVCYAFITKFPLLEFFFDVLLDLITMEKLGRMSLMQESGGEHDELDGYSYIPDDLLASVLKRLTLIPPPR
jgi:hypothetical protein